MGLLDFLPQLDENKKMALLQAAAQMMQARGNASQQIGAGIGGGLLGYNTSRGLADRRAEEEQQRQLRARQIDEMDRAAADRATVSNVYSRNTMPGNLTPNDDEGNAMPAAPQGFNLE